MKSILSLLFVAAICYSTAFSQDRIYWGDQNGVSNVDYIYSVLANDLSSKASVYGDMGLNPNGLAYYQANPTYPLFYVANRIYVNDLANHSDDIVVPSGQFSRGIAIDYVGKKIYWANSNDGYIGRADLDGSNATESFITGLNGPWDVEIDPINKKIYWSETDYPNTNAFIQRANLSDGSDIETVISNVNSQGIAVDPLRGKLYYGIFAASGSLHSANLDGSGDVVIPGLAPNADVDFDVRTGKLYMIDYSSKLLIKANPDGSNKVSISEGGTFVAYADVTVPTILSIARQSPPTANVGEGGTAKFRVTFSEPVLSVDAADFELTGTPTGTISVTPVSLNTVYDVVVSDISGTGTLDLNVASTDDVIDFGGNPVDGAIGTEETFTVITAPAPTIASFDPLFGSEGTTVTITGTNFSTTPSENIVTFNGIAATVTASTATEITTTVPAGAATGPLQVSTLGLTATATGDFSICTPPPVPTIARDGNVLTSSADDFNQWLKDGAEISGATNKTLNAEEPGAYTLRVASGMCTSVSDPVVVTEAELTPTISGFDPASAKVGEAVTISGTNFSTTAADNTVKFAGVAASVTASTLTSITTSVPAGTPVGATEVTVTVNGRTGTDATSFTVLCTAPPKPTITSDGGLLTSSSDTNNQWLLNGAEISGATGKTYDSTEPGAYTVRVTSDGCSTESDPTTVVGVEEFFGTGVTLYPNPSQSSVHIELSSTERHARAELYTTTGVRKESILLSTENGTASGDVNVEPYADGMYVIVITTGHRVIAKKFQKR